MKKQNVILATFLMSVFAAPTGLAQSSSAPVKITAWGQHYGGQVIYKYQVQNFGQVPIKRFLIGHYQHQTNGAAELTISPNTESSTSFWIPSQTATSPNGWGARVVYPEESSTFSIEWIEGNYLRQLWPQIPQSGSTPAASQSGSGIPPGATWNNFSVATPRMDAAYVSGHALVDNGKDLINLPITKGDISSPTINLTVNRLNQNEGNGTWAIFDVRATVTDDYDPNPTLVFEPISSSQTLQAGDVVIANNNKAWNIKLKNVPGKAYQFRFMSMDASGNVAVKTYSYVVTSKGGS